MANLVFRSIELHNFAAYNGLVSVNFSTSQRNITLIRGRNTGGKTSFINAIKWVLYGFIEKPTTYYSPLENHDLFNSQAIKQGKSEMAVVLFVDIKGVTHEIHRKITRKSTIAKPISNDDFSMTFAVKREDVILSETESNNLIKKFAPNEISRFFLFDGELLKEYEELVNSRTKRSDSKLVDAIEDVLGLPALKLAEQALGDVIREFDKELLDKNKENSELTVFIEENKRFLSEQEDLELQIQQNLNQITQYGSDIAELSKITKGNEEYAEIKHELSLWEKQLKDKKKDLKKCSEAITQLTPMLSNDLLRGRLQEERASALALAEKANEQTEVVNKQRYHIEHIEKLLDTDHCGTCGQSIPESLKADLKESLAQSLATLETHQVNAETTREYFSKSRMASECIERLQPSYADYKLQLRFKERLLDEIEDVENKIDDARTRAETVDIEAIYTASTEVRHLEDEIAILTNLNKEMQQRIDSLDTMIERNNQSIEERAVTKQTDLQHNYAVSKSLKKVFQTGRTELREHMRVKVEEFATSAYCAMIHEEDHRRIAISQNNYKLAILDKYDQEIVNPSAGATQILALALIIALGKAGRPIGPIVMDTPFGRLDEEHRLAILQYLPQQVSQLVLLYHSGELQEDSLAYVKADVGVEYEILKEQEGHSSIEEIANV